MLFLIHPVRWLFVALIAALSLLGAAHAFETFGHMAPCELCLKQRDVYWAVVWSSLALILVRRFAPASLNTDRIVKWGCLLLALLFLGEAGVAAYHAGVEWKWWPGPAACTGGPNLHISMSDLSDFAKGKRYNVVRCDEAAWRMFGISMAGYNVPLALGLSALSALSGRRPL
jgi:disulfide bond formation protein DsbB